ncbi:hypothetical protein GGR58DRAFT_505865 [Xylaria digitata]|nr:hypothetical protein GGR58DRAFT_505865 [Xylaria digitata]
MPLATFVFDQTCYIRIVSSFTSSSLVMIYDLFLVGQQVGMRTTSNPYIIFQKEKRLSVHFLWRITTNN